MYGITEFFWTSSIFLFPKGNNVSETDNLIYWTHWSGEFSGWGYLFSTEPPEYVTPIVSPEDEKRSSYRNVVFFATAS
jgi:hypothetical protein